MWRLILKYLAAGAACPVASKVFIIKMTMSGCLCISLACAALSDSLYTVLGRGILHIVITSFASLMGSRYKMILFLSCLLYPYSQTCRCVHHLPFWICLQSVYLWFHFGCQSHVQIYTLIPQMGNVS